MKRNLFLMLIVLTASVALMGCNTMQGAGKDIQRAGEKIEDAAEN